MTGAELTRPLRRRPAADSCTHPGRPQRFEPARPGLDWSGAQGRPGFFVALLWPLSAQLAQRAGLVAVATGPPDALGSLR
jgi:hypothetical protein